MSSTFNGWPCIVSMSLLGLTKHHRAYGPPLHGRGRHEVSVARWSGASKLHCLVHGLAWCRFGVYCPCPSFSATLGPAPLSNPVPPTPQSNCGYLNDLGYVTWRSQAIVHLSRVTRRTADGILGYDAWRESQEKRRWVMSDECLYAGDIPAAGGSPRRCMYIAVQRH